MDPAAANNAAESEDRRVTAHVQRQLQPGASPAALEWPTAAASESALKAWLEVVGDHHGPLLDALQRIPALLPPPGPDTRGQSQPAAALAVVLACVPWVTHGLRVAAEPAPARAAASSELEVDSNPDGHWHRGDCLRAAIARHALVLLKCLCCEHRQAAAAHCAATVVGPIVSCAWRHLGDAKLVEQCLVYLGMLGEHWQPPANNPPTRASHAYVRSVLDSETLPAILAIIKAHQRSSRVVAAGLLALTPPTTVSGRPSPYGGSESQPEPEPLGPTGGDHGGDTAPTSTGCATPRAGPWRELAARIAASHALPNLILPLLQLHAGRPEVLAAGLALLASVARYPECAEGVVAAGGARAPTIVGGDYLAIWTLGQAAAFAEHIGADLPMLGASGAHLGERSHSFGSAPTSSWAESRPGLPMRPVKLVAVVAALDFLRHLVLARGQMSVDVGEQLLMHPGTTVTDALSHLLLHCCATHRHGPSLPSAAAAAGDNSLASSPPSRHYHSAALDSSGSLRVPGPSGWQQEVAMAATRLVESLAAHPVARRLGVHWQPDGLSLTSALLPSVLHVLGAHSLDAGVVEACLACVANLVKHWQPESVIGDTSAEAAWGSLVHVGDGGGGQDAATASGHGPGASGGATYLGSGLGAPLVQVGRVGPGQWQQPPVLVGSSSTGLLLDASHVAAVVLPFVLGALEAHGRTSSQVALHALSCLRDLSCHRGARRHLRPTLPPVLDVTVLHCLQHRPRAGSASIVHFAMQLCCNMISDIGSDGGSDARRLARAILAAAVAALHGHASDVSVVYPALLAAAAVVDFESEFDTDSDSKLCGSSSGLGLPGPAMGAAVTGQAAGALAALQRFGGTSVLAGLRLTAAALQVLLPVVHQLDDAPAASISVATVMRGALSPSRIRAAPMTASHDATPGRDHHDATGFVEAQAQHLMHWYEPGPLDAVIQFRIARADIVRVQELGTAALGSLQACEVRA